MRGVVLCCLGIVSLLAVRFSPAATTDALVARGRYVATDVAMCVQCHSPRDSRGALDRSRLFTGASMPVRSPFPDKTWAFSAPAIAGLPGWSDEDAVTLLTTGRRPDGYVPKGPMPPFRLSRDDAQAVVAFLRTLR